MAAALSSVGYFLYLDKSYTPVSVVVSVIAFNAAFGFSWGPIPWVGTRSPAFRPQLNEFTCSSTLLRFFPSHSESRVSPCQQCVHSDRDGFHSLRANFFRVPTGYSTTLCVCARPEGSRRLAATDLWQQVGEATPILQEAIRWRLYPMHAFFCLCSFVVVYFAYPETMGIPLEEMGKLVASLRTDFDLTLA